MIMLFIIIWLFHSYKLSQILINKLSILLKVQKKFLGWFLDVNGFILEKLFKLLDNVELIIFFDYGISFKFFLLLDFPTKIG